MLLSQGPLHPKYPLLLQCIVTAGPSHDIFMIVTWGMAPAVNADVKLRHHTWSTFSLLYFFRRDDSDSDAGVHLPHTVMITPTGNAPEASPCLFLWIQLKMDQLFVPDVCSFCLFSQCSCRKFSELTFSRLLLTVSLCTIDLLAGHERNSFFSILGEMYKTNRTQR